MGSELKKIEDELSLAERLQEICSDIALQSRKEGFFNQWSLQVQQYFTKDFLENFKTSTSDKERISKLWELECVHSLDIQPFYTGKNSAISQQRRQKGNEAFQKKEYEAALSMYTQAINRAPPNGENISLAFANRSAVLFHLEEYKYCLEDITAALEAEYPGKLRYKILERSGQCWFQLGDYEKSQMYFNQAVTALKVAQMEKSKYDIWMQELSIKLQNCRNKPTKKETETEITNFKDQDPLFKGTSPIFPHSSLTLGVENSTETGRYMVAKEDIPTGKAIVREMPFSSLLMTEKRGSFCEHCFVKLIASIPCKICSSVAFCTASCRDKACESYHKWECPFLDLFKASGMSLICGLSLRIITERSLSYFKKNWPSVTNSISLPSKDKPHQPQNYQSLYNLVALENQRSVRDMLQRTLMSIFLLKVLRISKYFGYCKSENETLTEDELMIGSLLLRHLQVIQFNAHEVSGISYEGEVSYKKCKSIYLGLAVYPTVSFFNHSCHPAVARYFNGAEMTVVTIRPIKKGEMIPENYGPIFTHQNLQERQKKLLSRYWFKCTCEACILNWSQYSDMDNTIKIKSNAEISTKKKKKKGSKNAKKDDLNLLEYVTNLHKEYDNGVCHMDKNEREEAIKCYCKWLDGAAPVMKLPNKDIHLAVQSLRLLVGSRGTYNVTKK